MCFMGQHGFQAPLHSLPHLPWPSPPRAAWSLVCAALPTCPKWWMQNSTPTPPVTSFRPQQLHWGSMLWPLGGHQHHSVLAETRPRALEQAGWGPPVGTRKEQQRWTSVQGRGQRPVLADPLSQCSPCCLTPVVHSAEGTGI